jgi:hypothetical protein
MPAQIAYWAVSLAAAGFLAVHILFEVVSVRAGARTELAGNFRN